MVLTRTGAICTAREFISPRTAALAIEMVLDPGNGRHLESPPKMTTDALSLNFSKAQSTAIA